MLEAKTVREIERHLGRIADALECLTQPPADPEPCQHEQRELMKNSTMTDVRYRCTDCGAENLL